MKLWSTQRKIYNTMEIILETSWVSWLPRSSLVSFASGSEQGFLSEQQPVLKPEQWPKNCINRRSNFLSNKYKRPVWMNRTNFVTVAMMSAFELWSILFQIVFTFSHNSTYLCIGFMLSSDNSRVFWSHLNSVYFSS